MNARWRAAAGLHTAPARLPVEGELPPFGGAAGWLNSPPLTPAGLRGKVALIDFWTYTCINWPRQLPYPRAWAGKYSGDGLVVIGVHTPEFPFEHDVDNVRRAVKSTRVDYLCVASPLPWCCPSRPSAAWKTCPSGCVTRAPLPLQVADQASAS